MGAQDGLRATDGIQREERAGVRAASETSRRRAQRRARRACETDRVPGLIRCEVVSFAL